MNIISFSSLFFLSQFFLFSCLPHQLTATYSGSIPPSPPSGHPYCTPAPPPPPPPLPPCYQSPPPPPAFESKRIERDYRTIQKFKPKIKYDSLGITKTWKGNDVCKYKGFVCDKPPGSNGRAVAGVDFNGFLFNGPNFTLQEFLDDIPDITLFHANSNNFTGEIPKNISKLRYLYELDLSNNNFSGKFPTEILGAKLLTFLDLRFNQFSGSVPPQLFTLDVNVIFINNNKFTQKLPDNFGSTPALYLTFANNEFTGPIPRSIGQANKTLREVLFLNNKFSGCLPYEIGLLEQAVLFDVSRNWLTGPIPHSFGCLAKMELLNLAYNKFYGTVPEVVCELPKIGNLSLSNNYFTQVGPECRKLINKRILDVSKNCILDLPNQRSGAECAEFFNKSMYCHNENVLRTYVPCKRNWFLNSDKKPDFHGGVPRGTLMRSYGALTPNGL